MRGETSSGAGEVAAAAEADALAAAAEADALAALASSVPSFVAGGSLDEALAALARAAALATGSHAVVVRTAETAGGPLLARAVHAASAAVAAELEGSRVDPAEIGTDEAEFQARARGSAPRAVRRAAACADARRVHVFPAVAGGLVDATLELFRADAPLPERARALARLAAAHAGLAVRLERLGAAGDGNGARGGLALELAGDALAASTDEAETARQVARLAAEATGAAGVLTWRIDAEAPPALLAAHGFDGDVPDRAAAADAVLTAVERRERDVAAAREPDGGGRAWPGAVATLPLGEPPVGALQLYFEGAPPPEHDLDALSGFAARAAIALRRSRAAQATALALARSQTVIAVVGQAIARLSLAHTLDTAVERISELTGGRVAVYLREGGRLVAAASRGLEGLHEDLAERLLDRALGPFRSRGFLVVEDMRRDARLRGLEAIVAGTGIGRALLVPLAVRDEVIGALAVFEPRPRRYREGEEALVIALSTQLAVAVQNARLHERAKELGEGLERALDAERAAARQLRALYDISRSFTESLSLDATLATIARTMVELFNLDAAVIRLPDESGRELVARAAHVRDPNLADPARVVLARPEPTTAPLARRLFRGGAPIILSPEAAHGSDAHRLLEPFLVKGSTAAVLPMTVTGEVLGTMTLLSLDPARPLARETVEAAMSVTPHAALAIDNARLYQQQKDFSDEMQRSLLPRALPAVAGLEVGHVYESSTRLDVGGDVYDFLSLEDGRLAVVLGDVTGKGIQAAADMALAKFAFRALARSHPEPSAFLARANEVVVEEIAPGKFITMVYLLVDPRARKLAAASAGHPPVAVVAPDGTVASLAPRGLALGIEPDQEYPEDRVRLRRGAAVFLCTDGLLEARRRGELYGEKRLEEALRAHAALPAQELAEAVLADCRAFAGAELADDCAVVVLRLAE